MNAERRTQNVARRPLAGEPGTPAPDRVLVLAGIPCLNTAAHIADVVARARPFVDEVVVVDDGSTDDTAVLAAAAGATVLTHDRNMGVGAALRTCFEYASDLGATALVTLDGDGQHYPEDIPSLVAPILEGRASMVLGSRFLKADRVSPVLNMPRYRAFGIRVITFLFNLASGCRVTDSQCGLRAYDAQSLRELRPRSDGFEWSIELPVKARARGIRMAEVPVGCVYHEGGSTMHPVRQGVRLVVAVLRMRARAVLARSGERLLPARTESEASTGPRCSATCSKHGGAR